MASHQQSTVRCPFLLLLVAFGALALLSPIPTYAQDLESELKEPTDALEQFKLAEKYFKGAGVPK